MDRREFKPKYEDALNRSNIGGAYSVDDKLHDAIQTIVKEKGQTRSSAAQIEEVFLQAESMFDMWIEQSEDTLEVVDNFIINFDFKDFAKQIINN